MAVGNEHLKHSEAKDAIDIPTSTRPPPGRGRCQPYGSHSTTLSSARSEEMYDLFSGQLRMISITYSSAATIGTNLHLRRLLICGSSKSNFVRSIRTRTVTHTVSQAYKLILQTNPADTKYGWRWKADFKLVAPSNTYLKIDLNDDLSSGANTPPLTSNQQILYDVSSDCASCRTVASLSFGDFMPAVNYRLALSEDQEAQLDLVSGLSMRNSIYAYRPARGVDCQVVNPQSWKAAGRQQRASQALRREIYLRHQQVRDIHLAASSRKLFQPLGPVQLRPRQRKGLHPSHRSVKDDIDYLVSPPAMPAAPSSGPHRMCYLPASSIARFFIANESRPYQILLVLEDEFNVGTYRAYLKTNLNDDLSPGAGTPPSTLDHPHNLSSALRNLQNEHFVEFRRFYACSGLYAGVERDRHAMSSRIQRSLGDENEEKYTESSRIQV
ncbi:hypothetical protein BJ912DRAFT_1058707 [Pholiota molesta]|nr:hypothetical protein BJ912DRAFT_1058707 [Pholiota molesta]